MSDLSPDALALIGQARDADDPTADDRARVRLALVAKIAAVSVAASVSSVSTSAAAAAAPAAAGGAFGTAGLSAGLVAKVTLPLLLVGGMIGGGVIVTRDRPAARAPAPPPAVPVAPTVAAPVARPTPTPVARLEASPPPVVEPIAATEAPPPVRPRRIVAAPVTKPPNTLPDELDLLRRARAAKDPTIALALLDEHAATYASGVLAEEASALRVEALCRLDRVAEARAEADRFETRWPRSPLAARTRASCAKKETRP